MTPNRSGPVVLRPRRCCWLGWDVETRRFFFALMPKKNAEKMPSFVWRNAENCSPFYGAHYYRTSTDGNLKATPTPRGHSANKDANKDCRKQGMAQGTRRRNRNIDE